MQLSRYFLSIVRRWLGVLLLAGLLAGFTSFWVGKQQPNAYEAKVQVVIGPGIDSPNPDLNSLRAGGQLMQTYAELVTTRPVLQAVIDELGLGVPPSALRDLITVRADSATQILTIRVQDSDPERVALIANGLANMLLRLSPAGDGNAENQLREQMRNQVANLEQLIAKTEARIEELEIQLQNAAEAPPDPVASTVIATTQARIQQLEAQLTATTDVEAQRAILDQLTQERVRLFDAQRLETQGQQIILEQLTHERTRLADAQRTLALLSTSLQSSVTNQVKIVDPAVTGTPVSSSLKLRVVLAAVAGLILALATALIFEYFNDTIESPEDLGQRTSVPLLGVISKHEGLAGTGSDRLIVQARPDSRAAEDYRMAGTKILFSDGERPLPSVLISTLQTGDDGAEMAANLAVTLAQTGSRVVLVDANLRAPAIHKLFGVPQGSGLTGVLTGKIEELPLERIEWVPSLQILPAGAAVTNPFELLASPDLVDLLERLKEQADIILVVASPLLSFADSLILATRVDGVVLATFLGKTRREIVSEAAERLESLGVRVVGTLLHYGHYGRIRFTLERTRRSAPAKGRPAVQVSDAST